MAKSEKVTKSGEILIAKIAKNRGFCSSAVGDFCGLRSKLDKVKFSPLFVTFSLFATFASHFGINVFTANYVGESSKSPYNFF